MSIRQMLAIAAAVVAPIGFVAPAAAYSATSHASLPSRHAASTEKSLVDLLAGSPKYLVYIRAGLLPAGGHVDGPAINAPWTHLFVRTRSGSTHDLGHAPAGLREAMSISGSMLTGASDVPNAGGFRAAYWWNLKTHNHGRLHVPAGYTYLASAPHGAVLSKHGKLYRLTTGGKRSLLGSPFHGSPIARAVSSSHGIVVTRGATGSAPTEIALLRFRHPHHFTALRSGTDLALVCPSMDSKAVACAAEDNEGGINAIKLIPLNGHAPTTITAGALGEELAMNGRHAIWNAGTTLRSAHLGSQKVTTGNDRVMATRYLRSVAGTDPWAEIRQFGPSMIGGLGGAVELQHFDKDVALAKSVHRATRLFTAPHSPAAVSDFRLNDGRVAYATDQRIHHHANAQFSTFTATVKSAHGRRALSVPKMLHAGSDYVLAGVSKSTTVYSVRSGQEHSDLVISYKGHKHTIKHVAFDSYLQVSGHRVMFARQRHQGGPTAVYDAATRKTTIVHTDAACCAWQDQGKYIGRTPAINGSRVFYSKTDGSVWQHDLSSGTETQLSAPNGATYHGIVFAAGNHVAWSLRGHGKRSNAYVDLAKAGKPVPVRQRIVGMSKAGVLTTTGDLGYHDGRVGFLGSYAVRSFSGKQAEVLSKRIVFVLPQIEGHTVAWVSAAGRLRVKHF